MDMKKFYAKCLQGNVLEAIDYLKSFENKSEEIIELEQKYKKRFITQDEVLKIDSEDPWSQEVLKCYYTYFRDVLTNNNHKECVKQLTDSLAKILGMNDAVDLDEIEMKLESVFKEKGYSFLGGITSPYRGPYIWRTTKRDDFDVELPCGNQKLTVFFISGFIMLSWAHYATFGRHHAGGWAKEEGIYYVDSGNKEIDVESIDFQVWFLKHEAQHLSDFCKYPNLNSADLEYRAKLVELIYYPNPLRRLEFFINESKNDKTLAHPYASFLLVKGLSNEVFGEDGVTDLDKWRTIDSTVISKEALKLFMENEQALSERNCEIKIES